MAGMDIFNSDAFSAVEMTEALDKVPYRPSFLQSLSIFEPRPVRTRSVAVEARDGTLTIVPTSPVGAPPTRRSRDRRNIRNFNTVRLALADTIYSEEIQGIRAFGTMTELEQVADEVMRRMLTVREDVRLTHERMRLGAIQGIVLDSDDSVIINWFDEWDISQPAEIDFDLDNASPASGAVRKKCNQVIRSMARNAKGAWVEGQTSVMGLCGNSFWDDLTAHPEIRETYLNQVAAQELRNDVGTPYGMFRYGEITWVNYRGTDDQSTVSVGTDKVHFFPVGGRQVFQHAMAPAESFDFVNTPGQEFYAMQIPDEKRNQFVDVEVYSYPLFLCTRPEMLQRGKRT